MTSPWQFWIDVGGTFTDCIGIDPDGRLRQHKTLSSGITKGTVAKSPSPTCFVDPHRGKDPPGFWNGSSIRLFDRSGRCIASSTVECFSGDSGRIDVASELFFEPGQRYELDLQIPAPILAIRWLLQLRPGESIPLVTVRLGTTRGTNALLTRTGARTALITTSGFGDVPLIGNQDRPKLFDLEICKPEPLFETVVEVSERVAADGKILERLDYDHAQCLLKDLHQNGLESVAICLMNAWVRPQHEFELLRLARQAGFTEVSHSYEVSPQIRFVPRCDTTVLDAYLNPILRAYVSEIRQHLEGSRILVMTSAGGLVRSSAFRGRDSILSGPAGGVVGFSRVASDAGFDQAIGFDMGGTSTDVARFGGRFEYEQETSKAGVRIMTPVLAIETVAAGGGSICEFDGVRLHVGPASAAADPGPACYGSGGPLTVTDLNVYLGRVLSRYFPFELDVAAVKEQLEQLRRSMQQCDAWQATMSLHSLAEGLLQIANDNMVQAIRRVSITKGYDPADHVLVSFGGAGGQHACSVARALGITHVLMHPFAGILSAWGMGQADVRNRRKKSVLSPLTEESLEQLVRIVNSLTIETVNHVQRQGIDRSEIDDPVVELELRYSGTESTVVVPWASALICRQKFEKEYRRLFGYIRPDRPIEIASVIVEAVGQAVVPEEREQSEEVASGAIPDSATTTYLDGQHLETDIYLRDSLQPGCVLNGPVIISEPTSTILIESGCRAEVLVNGSILITICKRGQRNELSSESTALPDPVLLEVFNNQFVSIAEQMGQTLRRTSVSTNVRERLDYSCALFDRLGHLVVNAPHIPVHLGAMGETVCAIIQDHPDMQPGDVYVTNDPYRGGSHLPDVTVVTPVFTEGSIPSFFVANRAHHAEIGGIVPGSMPPFSTCLAEEGVLIRSRHLVRAGNSLEDELRAHLSEGAFPSRSVDDNLADLAAQAAANACGASLLMQLCRTRTVHQVQQYMLHVQKAAERKMRLALSRLEDRDWNFIDQLDDGSAIQVRIAVDDDSATVDFTGSADVHPGNLNANRAITTAAVLYAFRCLLNEDVPLNNGVLRPLNVIIPSGLLNPPAGEDLSNSPAMVGGNVETSQRIVDVLLGALRLAAASQGTMNNLTFGDGTFGFYETICGGAGATPKRHGADAVHTHMTNTRLTDPEILEQRYPVRLRQFSIRRGSGGNGKFRGGDGIIREIEFLKDLQVSMLSQRRTIAPWGLDGGNPGLTGRNSVVVNNAHVEIDLPGAFSRPFHVGETLRIETPGGGGAGPVTP